MNTAEKDKSAEVCYAETTTCRKGSMMDALITAAASAAQAAMLPAQARSVLAVLADASTIHEPHGDPSCWLAAATIAARAGASTRTVGRQLAVLADAGIIAAAARRRNPDTGNWAPTVRWLRVDRICELADGRHARILTAAVAAGRERCAEGHTIPLPAAAAQAAPQPEPEKETLAPMPAPQPQPAAEPGDDYYQTRPDALDTLVQDILAGDKPPIPIPDDAAIEDDTIWAEPGDDTPSVHDSPLPAQVAEDTAPGPQASRLNWAGLIDTGRASGASKTETLAAASIAAGRHLDTLRAIHDQHIIDTAADVLFAWERLRTAHPRSPLSVHDRDTAAAPWEARCLTAPDPAAYADLLPDAARRYAAATEPRYHRPLARWLDDGCTQWVSHDRAHPSERTVTDALAPTDAPVATKAQAASHIAELRAIIAGVGRTA